MYGLLKYTDLDLAIQTRMSNQAPNSTKRLEYINNLMKDLITRYNVEVAKRTVIVELKPNGEAIDIDTIITNLDCKKIDKIRVSEPENRTQDYVPVEEDVFTNNYAANLRKNEWSFYTENRKRYLKINSLDYNEDETVKFKITYFTTNLAVDDTSSGEDGFIPEVINSSSCYLLIPAEWKELAVSGITQHLYLISLGMVDGEKYAAIAKNQYKSELERFGLNKEARKIRIDESCVQIHSLI
jgi:transcriptional antiterminator Rof (Rho-off)